MAGGERGVAEVVARGRTPIGVAVLVLMAVAARVLDGPGALAVSIGGFLLLLACWVAVWRRPSPPA